MHQNVTAAQFNGLAAFPRVEPSGKIFVDTVFDRFNTGTNTNELWGRALSVHPTNPVIMSAGPPRVIIRGAGGSVIYGLDMTRSREP